MPKYLIQGSYTADGLKGLMKDKASGRKAAVVAAMKSIKSKLESMYFTLGADDVTLIVEAPDNVTIAALSIAASAQGMVRIRTTPLLSVAEVDQALETIPKYRAPGQ
jgi:uncharacterized protein with GYD domain